MVRTLDIGYCPVGEVGAWRERGGTSDAEHGASGGLFWCRLYEPASGRFEYPVEGGVLPLDSTMLLCALCEKRERREEERAFRETVKLSLDPERQVVVAWPGLELGPGDLVYLEDIAGQATDLRLRSVRPRAVTLPPTFYRPHEEVKEQWDKKVWDPLIVVMIKKVEKHRVLVTPFYHPQNMHLTYEQAREHDLTVLYYTGLEIWLARNQLASYVVAQGGQPHLVYGPPSMRHALVHKVKAAAPLEHKVKIPEALVHKVKTPEALVHKVKAAAPLERKVKTPEAYKHKVKAAVPLEHKVKTTEALEHKMKECSVVLLRSRSLDAIGKYPMFVAGSSSSNQ